MTAVCTSLQQPIHHLTSTVLQPPSSTMENQQLPQFYIHPQSTALSTFLPLLKPYLPHSNPLYNRLQAPHNTPSRHCLFIASFPPSSTPPPPSSKPHTILFSDRSRHQESQIWLFHPLITRPELNSTEQDILTTSLKAAIEFLRNTEVREAPGWPFSPLLRFAGLHEHFVKSLYEITTGRKEGVVPYRTDWNVWNIRIPPAFSEAGDEKKKRRKLPENFTLSRVPEDQLDVVISTSSIPRQASTMLLLPSMGLLNQSGKLVAWAHIGIDGSLATLYVLPEVRGRGFAGLVVRELLGRLGRGEYRDLGFEGESAWVHADVKEGNRESEGVMRRIGGERGWVVSYLWVDLERF